MAGQFMQICGMLNTVSNGVPVGANFTSVVLNHLHEKVHRNNIMEPLYSGGHHWE